MDAEEARKKRLLKHPVLLTNCVYKLQQYSILLENISMLKNSFQYFVGIKNFLGSILQIFFYLLTSPYFQVTQNFFHFLMNRQHQVTEKVFFFVNNKYL